VLYIIVILFRTSRLPRTVHGDILKNLLAPTAGGITSILHGHYFDVPIVSVDASSQSYYLLSTNFS
jgi:hypothetical protein